MKEKIITVDLKKSKIIRANSQWQYNYGQKLKFNGVELPPTYQVHFSNSVKGEAKTQIGDETGVLIPPEYFIPGSEIHAWIHLQDEDSGVTEWEIIIPILKKALPTDQDPDEHETTVIDEAINALNNALETVDDRIDNALQEAKESGEFDGEDGVSPVVRTEEIEGGTRIIITDATGDHSFNVMNGENITEIVYFYGYLSNGALLRVTMDHFGFDELRNCINAGKTPIGIITIPSRHPAKDSHDEPVVVNETEYLVMSLTEWYKDKADLVSGNDGDDYFGVYRGIYATFSSVIQNDSYTLNLEWSIRKLSPLTYGWTWTLVPTTLATVGDLDKKIKYFDFTINYDIEYADGSNGINTLCELSDIQDAYNSNYVIFARLIDNGSDIILPLVIPPRNYGQSYNGSGQIISDGYWQIMFGMDTRIPIADVESPDELYPVYRIILDYDSFRSDDQQWRVYQNEAEKLPDLSAYRTAAEQDIIDGGQNDAINLKYTKPSGGIPKTDLASAVQTSLAKADTALQSYTETDPTVPSWAKASTKPSYTASDVGAVALNQGVAHADEFLVVGSDGKVTTKAMTTWTEQTISTAGAVTQALDPNVMYHFTGALTSLTVTATDPTTGKYQFDFVSGSIAPTLVVPASWVMPDNFLVEPSARYSLSIQNGYCSLEKWSDSHSPFIYLDWANGDFILNNSGLATGANVYANVGTEIAAITVGVKLKNQLTNNAWLTICDISANAKALIGSTYIFSVLSVGGGKVTQCVFNTWESSSEIRIKNNTGSALAANTEITGTIFILRTV